MTPQQAQYMNPDDRGQRSSREARQAARAAKNGSNGHYRRAQSPDLDEYAFSGGDEPRSPMSDIALQDAILAQAQHQQRVVPVGQQMARNPNQRKPPPNGSSNGNGGPPPNNNNNNNNINNSRGGLAPPPSKAQPPSYPGPPLEDSSSSNNNPANHNGQARQGHYRRNTNHAVRRPSEADGGPPTSGPESQNPSSPPRSAPAPNGRRAQLMGQESQRRPPSPGSRSLSGNSINRLNSPSVMKSVLQPLELKIQEYDHLMQEAQHQMLQLDEELRVMQERRMQAEERFVEAKAKHDDYERQHQGVGRALRGEPEVRIMSPEPLPRMERLDSYDERPVSNQSSHKAKGRSRLRLSLFKGN
ncbi:hypothetical protein AK830_g976 [Neonectria ditissima]|uniref:Uncharacterized protein n=1 Tax=Neonectria ditissima TaxID=78410 RepID=A0A0N8H8U4_9HYPO|nr:hypothetical protein AK830_g976 [Neonectria ditissima]